MAALRDQGVEQAYNRLLEDMFYECTSTIILHKKSRKFPIRKGVRQGDTISSKLFTACLESVFRKLYWETLCVRVNGEYLINLRFSEDIVLLCSSVEDLPKIIEDLHRGSVMVLEDKYEEI